MKPFDLAVACSWPKVTSVANVTLKDSEASSGMGTVGGEGGEQNRETNFLALVKNRYLSWCADAMTQTATSVGLTPASDFFLLPRKLFS